jgi:phosphate:Na+ symporter
VTIDWWQPLAGLGMFLFAMRQIEQALELASGRRLREFLRRNTDKPIRGVVTGTAVTAILQSSTLVGLMMLALTGAGVIQMRNALAVIFGANLGTTVTGWIVATIGFKLELDALALPLIAVGGLAYIVKTNKSAHQLARFVLSLGLLLMGIELMKTAAEDFGQYVDAETLAGYSAIQFLVFGIVFSGFVHSSSATMAVTLSALYSGVIDLPAAVAVAIGADLGTTSTVLLGAVRGTGAKKRVAAGHFLFNLATDLLAFTLRAPLLSFIAFVGISDNLISLVAFHSLFNLMGLVLFLPIIGPFADFLERRFIETDWGVSRHIRAVPPTVPEPAIEAIELETEHLLQRVIEQNLLVLDPPIRIAKGRPPIGSVEDPASRRVTTSDFASEYQTTKRLEGEILAFTVDVQSAELAPDQSDRIDRCQRAVREAVHASKSLKDAQADFAQFEASGLPAVAAYGQRFRDVLTEFFLAIYSVRRADTDRVTLDDIIKLNQVAHRGHEEIHRTIYTDIRRDLIEEADISSLLNANREIFSSCRALLTAIAALELPREQLETLEALPGSVL